MLTVRQHDEQQQPSTQKPSAAQWKLEELEWDGGMLEWQTRPVRGRQHSQVRGCQERKLQRL